MIFLNVAMLRARIREYGIKIVLKCLKERTEYLANS